VNRRAFLTLRREGTERAAELSCERLYMQYVDAEAEGATGELFDQLARDLRGVADVRLTETSWLACDDLKRRLDEVLARSE
jgi:hypothetical protein